MGIQEPVVSRGCKSSQWYVENTSGDMFEDAEPTLIESGVDETKEDSVIIHVSATERYEILPKTPWNVKVKHIVAEPGNREHLLQEREWVPAYPVGVKTSESDKKALEIAKQLLNYERTTTNPEFLKNVKKMNKPERAISVKVPRGTRVDPATRKKLEEVNRLILENDIKGAIKRCLI